MHGLHPGGGGGEGGGIGHMLRLPHIFKTRSCFEPSSDLSMHCSQMPEDYQACRGAFCKLNFRASITAGLIDRALHEIGLFSGQQKRRRNSAPGASLSFGLTAVCACLPLSAQLESGDFGVGTSLARGLVQALVGGRESVRQALQTIQR